MTEIRNVGQDVQAEIVKTARKGQEAVVGAIRIWTDTVRSITPPLKDLSLPFADRLPRPEELAVNAYEFAQKLLASQRKFAEEMLQAAAPRLPGINGTARKPGAARKTGTAQQTGTAESPGTAQKADTSSKAAATPKAATAQKTGTQKTGTTRRAATAHKAGPADQKNGSAAR